MIKRLKLLALLFPSLLFVAFPLSAKAANPPTNVLGPACANVSSGVCNSANGQSGNINQNPVSGKNGVIKKAADVIALFGGAIAVIVIIVAGITYTTAGGAATGQRAGDNPTRAKDARTAMIGAVIGLVAIALAWTVISFVTQHVLN